MLYLSIGLQGPVTDWCGSALARLCSGNGAKAAVAAGHALETAVLALIRNSGSSMAVTVSHPDRHLWSALSRTGAPFLLALTDLDQSLQHPADPASTVRATSAACIELMRFDGLAGALRIRADMIARDPQKVLSMIAAHFGLPVAGDEIARIAAAMPFKTVAVPNAPAAHAMTRNALGGYLSYFESGVMGDLVWTHELFRRALDPDRSLSEPVAMRDTAGGRFLIYGPYIDLPPGNWSVQLEMDISPDGGGHTLVVDVYCQRELAVARYTSRPGRMRTPPLNFSIPEPGGKHVEIHVLIEREGAPGHLSFHHATISPVRPRAAGAE